MRDEEDGILNDILGESDCSDCGGPCTGCVERAVKFANRFVVVWVIFAVIFFGLMIITLF